MTKKRAGWILRKVYVYPSKRDERGAKIKEARKDDVKYMKRVGKLKHCYMSVCWQKGHHLVVNYLGTSFACFALRECCSFGNSIHEGWFILYFVTHLPAIGLVIHILF